MTECLCENESTEIIDNTKENPSRIDRVFLRMNADSGELFTLFLAKWTESGEGDWRLSTSQSHSAPTLSGHPQSNAVLHSDDCDTSCTVELKDSVDLTGYGSASLSFWRFVDSGLDRDEYLRVDVFDGSSWKPIFHWSGNLGGDDNTWHHESYDLSQYLGTSNFSIRLVTQQSYYNEDVQVDNVLITASPGIPTVTSPSATYSVYVADTDDYEILAFAPDGTPIGHVVPSKSGGLGKPWDITFGPDGNLYVSDNTYSKIRKYSGSDGSLLGKTAGSAEWAQTFGYPNGLAWNGSTLYVATLKGVEKISSTGTHLGYFGDASRNPSTSGVPALISAYDIAFCPDGRMYVADKSMGKILYYDAATGKYGGTMYDSTSSSIYPNTYRASGLECGTAIRGTGTSLYQSGDDGGRVNEIDYSTKRTIHEFTLLIDEPYGMDLDGSGNLYVANKDDDNIVKISPAGTSSVFVSGLDDPRGVAIGPVYIASASQTRKDDIIGTRESSNRACIYCQRIVCPSSPASAMYEVAIGPVYIASASDEGASTESHTHNDSPEIELFAGGDLLRLPITTDRSSSQTITAIAIDEDGDAVSLGIVPDMLPAGAISLGIVPDMLPAGAISLGIVPDMLPAGAISITDHGNSTATLILDPSGMDAGAYTFMVTASDGQNGDVREPIGVIVE